MRPLPIPRTAKDAISNFKTRELAGLMSHLRLFGPLTPATPAASGTAEAQSGDVKSSALALPNPFIPRKNPKTGKWREPRYSLRRQADLVKMAKETHSLHLMPPGPKLSAIQLRTQRVHASLTPRDSKFLMAAEAPERSPNPRTPVERTQDKLEFIEEDLETRQRKIKALENKIREREGQHELDELATFEKDKVQPEADVQARLKRQGEFKTLKQELQDAHDRLRRTEMKLHFRKAQLRTREQEQVHEQLWQEPVWVGDVKQKEKKGSDLGIKLYAGKKKMFKGHLWEKEKVKRVRKQAMLMRDMSQRVERYKSFYKKRKPNPLRPSRYTKPPKLPF